MRIDRRTLRSLGCGAAAALALTAWLAGEARAEGVAVGPPPRQHRVLAFATPLTTSGSTCDCGGYDYEAAYVLGLEWDYLVRLSEHFRLGPGFRAAYGRSKGTGLSQHTEFVMLLFGPYFNWPGTSDEVELLIGLGLSLGQLQLSGGSHSSWLDMTGIGAEAGFNYVHGLGPQMGLVFGVAIRGLWGDNASVGDYNGIHAYHHATIAHVGLRW
jgi:hypothetical protein